jgi:hypothetical protein
MLFKISIPTLLLTIYITNYELEDNYESIIILWFKISVTTLLLTIYITDYKLEDNCESERIRKTLTHSHLSYVRCRPLGISEFRVSRSTHTTTATLIFVLLYYVIDYELRK